MRSLLSRHRSAYPRVKIPRKYDLSGLVTLASIRKSIEEVTGRSIIIEKGALTPLNGCSGALIRGESSDLIIIGSSSSHLYSQHVILHEFAHIIQDHERLTDRLDYSLGLDGRSMYDSALEYHAEAMADMMARTIRRTSNSTRLGLLQGPMHERVLSWRSLFSL